LLRNKLLQEKEEEEEEEESFNRGCNKP